MVFSRIASPNVVGGSPQVTTSGQAEAPTPTATPPTSPGDLASRNVQAASPATASLPPRATLPMGPMGSLETEFLKAVHTATQGQPTQSATVAQWLQLPEAQLRAVVNSQDENGDSALHKLAKSTNIKCVYRDDVCKDAPDMMRSLLNKGADPRLVNHEGKTPAEYVDRYTHIMLAPRVSYEMAHAGLLNQQRLGDNHAAFVADPIKGQALADARRQVREACHAAGSMFNNGMNRLKPYLVGDVARFVSGRPTPGLAHSVPFFGPAEHAQYSLFDADGRVSAHVAQGYKVEGTRQGNNLVLRFESDDAGRPMLKGLVFPRKLKEEDGRGAGRSARRQPHTTAYGGGAFAFAGEISADANGRITSISNMSGHNRPKPVLLAAVALYLQAQGVLAEDFAMALGTYSHQVEHRGVEAFDKAREVIAERWTDINPEARAKLAKQVHALEKQLKALGPATGQTHGTVRSDLSRQRALAYSQLKRAESESHFLELIGYDPVAGALNADAAPPRGSYRPSAPAEPDTPLLGERRQPEPASFG
jgi:hypothetical protein